MLLVAPGQLDGEDEYSPDYWQIIPGKRGYAEHARFAIPNGATDDLWHFNPKLAVRPGDLECVRLWLQCFDPSNGGLRHLPQSGGVLDQSAIMMDAFNVIAGAYASIKKPD